MTRSVEIPDAAVEAALDVVMDDGHNGLDCRPDRNLAVTVRAALEAALAYLAPVGDSGLREALENQTWRWDHEDCRVDLPENEKWAEGVAQGYRNAAADLRRLLAAHPAAPAVPQPVDREALERVIEETFDEMERDFGDEGPPMETLIGQLAGNVLAVLAGEQVERS